APLAGDGGVGRTLVRRDVPDTEATMKMPRREFLKALGAAGLAAGPLAGCAVSPMRSGPRVVVVGGGYGGATVAKYLDIWSNGTVDITIVESEAAFVSCPMSNLVLGG